MADSPPDAIMEGSAPPPPPKKRSLFTKKVVSKKAEAGDSVAFFSRAGELQAQKLAEEERRRKRKLVRLEREKERKRSTESRERKGTTPEQKRRRLSGKEDEDGYRDMDQQSSGGLRKSDGDHEDEDIIIRSRSESTHSTPGSWRGPQPPTQNKAPSPPKTLIGRFSQSLQESAAASTASKHKNVITLGSSDSEGEDPVPDRRQLAPPVRQPIEIGDGEDDYNPMRLQARSQDDDLSDEEFPELVQKARERERERELQRLKAAREANSGISKFGGQDAQVDHDPSIEILIFSNLPDTKPMRIKRKLSQKLEQARLAWCDSQNVPGTSTGDLRNTIILTWKHKRVYDSTTCQALGFRVDSQGKLSTPEDTGDRIKISLEAWTEASLAAYTRAEQDRIRRENADSDEEVEVVHVAQEVKIKVIMKAKEIEESLKLTVKPSTQISKLADAFSRARDVPEGRKIDLRLDGEVLDPESLVKDADIEDMDHIEVYFS